MSDKLVVKNRYVRSKLTQRIAIIDDNGRELGDVRGNYAELRGVLEDALNQLSPPPGWREELERVVWDGLLAQFRRRHEEMQVVESGDYEGTYDDLVDSITRIEIGVDEWDNGYFPANPKFYDDTHKFEIGYDEYYAGDDWYLHDGDLIEELRQLNDEDFGRFYSYTIRKPGEDK